MLLPDVALRPLPIQLQIVEHLRKVAPELWNWYAEPRTEAAEFEEAQQVRLELLKCSVRLERETHPKVFAAVEAAASALQIELPITLYQSAVDNERNAALWFLPDEVHIVLSGPIEDGLDDAELTALCAHELAHHALYQMEQGAYLVADRILKSAMVDPAAPESARITGARYRRAMEIYADRAALGVVGSLDAVIGCLLKTATGLKRIDAAAFVRQSEEILERDPGLRSKGLTHPEAFLRARAAAAFALPEEDAEAKVLRWIEGPLDIESLDLIDQHRVQALTLELIRATLAPTWMRSEALFAHARAFDAAWNEQQLDAPIDLAALGQKLAQEGTTLHDYWCYVLLDFAALSRDEEDLALWRGLEIAEHFAARERLLELARKELGRTKKALDKLAKDAPRLIEKLTATEGEAR